MINVGAEPLQGTAIMKPTTIHVQTGPKAEVAIARIATLRGEDAAWDLIERRWIWISRYPLEPLAFIPEPD